MAIMYDAIIIGSGQAGPPLAVRLAAAGMKMAIIERKRFGGTCVNTGCIPTKTLIASARGTYRAPRRRLWRDVGSYVGLKFSQMYRRFGREVTIVEMAPRLIKREDEDVSQASREILENEGIAIRLDAECIGVEKDGDKVVVNLDCSTGDRRVVGSHLLLAVGRVPNTDDLGLENAGVAVDQRGYVQVDDQLRTNVPGIYALGDCNGRGAFTDTSYNDYEIVAGNILDGDSRRVSDRITAYALYTDPPLGRAGATEAEVRKSGLKALLAIRRMTRVGRAVERRDPGIHENSRGRGD